MPGGIDPHTPFYQAGLGSLGMVRLHTALQSALGREFPLTELFSHPTEVELSAHLGELTGERAAETRRGDVRDRRIAIIGMAARFPGAPTLEQYWDNLLAGVVSTTRFSRDELLAAGLPASLVDDPAYVPVSGALDDIAAFDADLFGMSPAEAAVTDPQQRLFLQVCQQALEHAGYAGAAGRTGIYAGSGMALYSLRTYLRENLGGIDAGDQLAALQVAIGNDPDFLATRVAFRLGLTGPAVTVRTACSTSLVAVHTAINALLAGDADMALAGAAALHVPGVAGYRYEQGSILSSTGACRAFDAAADGTVGGNGVAAVLLKPLEAALADGDTVHAVILGSAINNDGSAKQGFTWPGVAGQVTVVRDALAAAGVEPGVRRLHRGPRHRHRPRRPDRGRGAPGDLRGSLRPVVGGVGEAQHRPPRHRRRHGRTAQGGPRPAYRDRAAAGQLRIAQPRAAAGRGLHHRADACPCRGRCRGFVGPG